MTLTVTNNVHSDTVFGVAFSPDDKMLASCGADKFVKVYEASDYNYSVSVSPDA